MAVNAGYLPLIFIIVTLLSTNQIPASADLIDDVCRNTTIFEFCSRVVRSNQFSRGADRFTLANIIFREAYENATRAKDFIVSWIRSNKTGARKETLAGMENCRRFYGWAIHSLSEALDCMYSDTYYELDRYSINVEGYGRVCDASFGGRSSPMSVTNQNLIKHSYICLSVSQLFPYMN